jgi:hypothetical protein
MMFCIRKYPLWCMSFLSELARSYRSAFCSSGAIRRLAVERETTSSITYENFVTDLDAGDAFTATLMDILVKVGVSVVFSSHSNDSIMISNDTHPRQEIADRRLRANATERSLLSERTVRSLRSLVNSSRTYTNRFRSHTRRPVVNIPEYLAVPPTGAGYDG